jgi:hypothetical protein
MLTGAPAGLAATAYSNFGGNILSSTVVSSHDDVRQGLQLSSPSQLYALYSGYFLATQRGLYTFRLLKNSPIKETIRFTAAGSTTIQILNGTNCNSSSYPNCDITATCILENPGNLYPVKIEYFRDDVSPLGGNFTLNFRFQNSEFSRMMPYVFPMIGSKTDALNILVSPATPRATSSIATGNCLTIATAGTACQFSITTRDEFGSPSSLTSNISILCSSFIDSSYVEGQVVGADGSVFKALFVPALAGNHILSIFVNQAVLQWTLLVTPSPLAAAQKSVVLGSALSIATAGLVSKFTIFAMDLYGNLLESARNIAVVVENDATSEYHALPVDNNRAANAMVFKDMTVSYRISQSGRYRITVAALDTGLTFSMSTESSVKDFQAPPMYVTTASDVSLQSYYTLSRDLFQQVNVTVSQISFSGFISAATSGVFTFKVLTGSTSDSIYLDIDRINLININSTCNSTKNGYLIANLDGSSLHDAVFKLNWPDSTQNLVSSAFEIWSPPSSAFSLTGSHGSCTNAVGAMINGNGAWCALIGNTMTIDLGVVKQIVGVATQGRSDADQWVTLFDIQTSIDGFTWSFSGQYSGNTDRNTIVNSIISPSVNARYVRLTIHNFIGYGSMRAGVLLKSSIVEPVSNSLIFSGNSFVADAGLYTWNIHTSGFSITIALLVTSMSSDQSLIHLFDSPGNLRHSIILELVVGSAFNIRFLIYNEVGNEVNSGCITINSISGPLLLNTKYVITATYDVAAKISKIYVNGLLQKTCPQGVNTAVGPRVLKFSYVGNTYNPWKYFKGKIFNLALYDRSLNDEEVKFQHQALNRQAAVATIALLGSSLYEFELNYSSVNFSRVSLMVSFAAFQVIFSYFSI